MKRRVRRKKKQTTSAATTVRPRLLWLVGAAVGAFVVGTLLRILSGYEAALVTGLFWLLAVLVAFFAGLFYFAYFILPIEGDRGWDVGFNLLQQFFFERLRGQSSASNVIPNSFRTIGAGMVESHQTLAIARNNEFTRATDPGFVRLHLGETITEVVDLRLQERIQVVKAITADGIPLTTTVMVRFQVKQAADNRDPRIQYPVDRDAIFRLTYSSSIGDETQLMLWYKRISRQIAADLAAEIAQYELEELYRSTGPSSINEIRKTLENGFREKFREAFAYQQPEDCPITNLTVSIGQLRPPSDVTEQRIRDWQTEWEARIRAIETDGEATILRNSKEEQRRTQVELTLNLLRNLNLMSQTSRSPEELKNTVRLYIMGLLEEAMNDEQNVQSRHMIIALDQVLSWLQGQEESDLRGQLGSGPA